MNLKNPGHFILLSVVLFTVVNVCVKELKHISHYELVFFRAIISLAMVAAWLKYKKISVWGNNKKLLVARGLAGTLALTLYFYTLQVMPLATAVILQYISPIFALIFAVILLKEVVVKSQWLYFALALAGVILVKGFDMRVGVVPLVAGIVAAVSSGLAYTFVSKLKDYDHPWVVVFYFPLTTIPIITPFMVNNWVMPKGADWLFIAIMGSFTTVAQYLLTRGYQGGAMGQVAIYRYLGVVLAIGIGYFGFAESVSWQSLGGMVLIMWSVYKVGRLRVRPSRS